MNLNELTAKLGITPNDMQTAVYEAFSKGDENLVVLSPTGTGKTLAYLMPVTQKIKQTSDDIQAVVVVPGRELALQSVTVLKNMGTQLCACACYGGRPTMDEHRILRQIRPQIIFGTPGRLIDHIDKGNVETDKIQFIIIDEFDKCLEMGFQNEMASLMQRLPVKARRIFLSATDSENNANNGEGKWMYKDREMPHELSYKNFKRIDFSDENEAVSNRIKVFSVLSPSKDKLETLERLLKTSGNESTIVFLNYRESVERTAAFLREKGFVLSVFHGGLDQRQREDQLFRFSNGSAPVMISTDLGSRGLDIPDIQNVIHYHLPETPEAYVHRVGRSARWDKDGRTFFILNDSEHIPEYVNDDVASFIIPAAGNDKVPLPKMTTLYIGKGKKDKISKGDVVGFLCKAAGISSSDIGRIDVRDYYTYVAVVRDKAKQVISKANNQKIKGHKTIIGEIR